MQLGPSELRVKTTLLAQITLRTKLSRINDSMRAFGRSPCVAIDSSQAIASFLSFERGLDENY